MKRIILLFSALFALVVLGAQIQTSGIGDHWHDPITWLGGVVPSSADAVVINHTVYVGPGASCSMLTVSFFGVLMNEAGVNGGLIIEFNLINYGLILNYAWGYNPGVLDIVIGGHVQNYRTLANHSISFNSFDMQVLSNTGDFNPSYLLDGMSTSPLVLDTDLIAGPGTNIDLNGSQLIMNGHSLTVQYSGGQGYLEEALIVGGGSASLIGVDGPSLQQVQADYITLLGSFAVVSFTANNLENHANLFCPIYGSGDLNIMQELRNFGSISNHPAGGSLNLYAYGTIFNYGTLNNYLLKFMGTAGRELILDDAAPAISCTIINTDGNAGDILTYSNLRLSGCSVYLPGRMLVLGGGCSLIHTGGYLSSLVIYGGIGNSITLNSLFMQDSEISGGSLYGYLEVKNTLTLHDVKNYATIQNFNYQNANIVTQLAFENHGILRNHPSGGSLNLSLDMFFSNYGEVSLNQINIINPNECYLWQDASAPAISCPNVVVNSASCVTQLISNISFANSTIDLASSTLVIGNEEAVYKLSLYECYLQNGEILGFQGSTIFGQAGFLSGISANYLETEGLVFIYNTVSIDTLVNRGNIRNRDYWGGTLVCSTRLENYQNITNSLYGGSHSLEIQGDLYNYGTLSPHRVWVNGNSNQYLRNAGTSNPDLGFTLVSELGISRWYFNGELSGPEYLLNKTIDPYQLGVWQPVLGSVFGRQITLGTGITLAAPEIVSFDDLNGTLKLVWSEVPDTVYYRVYSSADTDGPFTIYNSSVTDSIPGDGEVTLDILSTQQLRFFRVTAFN